MKKYVFFSMLLMLSWFSYGLTEIPAFNSHIIDTTNTLSASQVKSLESSLIQFEHSKTDGAQIAVLMIAKLDNETIEQYAQRVFNQWKIGRKGLDNGILLLVVKDDRQMRIEVGYGLEGIVTDLVASHIIREQLAPQFKQNNYYQGIDDAVSVLKSAIIGNNIYLENQTQDNQTIGLSEMLDMLFHWIAQLSWKVCSFLVCLALTVKFEKNIFKRIIITSLSNSLFILFVTWCVDGFSDLDLTDVVFIFVINYVFANLLIIAIFIAISCKNGTINYVFANLLFTAISRKNGTIESHSESDSSSRSSSDHSSRNSQDGGGGRSGGGGASGRW